MRINTSPTIITLAFAVSATANSPWLQQALGRSEYTFRLQTYNLRYDSKPDNITVQETIHSLPRGLPEMPTRYYPNTSEQPWSTRRIGIATDVLFARTDILCVQEALKRQVDDLQELLGDAWDYVGVGRDDGEEAGEFEAIFYQKKSFKVLQWDTFWLSDSPFEPSKHPDAGSFRSCTRARFSTASSKSNGNRATFTLLNTHLDDQSDVQRRLGASLLLHRAKYEAITTKRPVFVAGDFNSPAAGADSGAYRIATGDFEPVPLNSSFEQRFSWKPVHDRDFWLRDLLVETPPARRSGGLATFTGFSAVGEEAAFQRIDFIFGGLGSGWSASLYHVGDNLYDNGVYHSDHRPVYAELSITS